MEELWLAGAMRARSELMRPGDSAAAERAIAVALRAFAAGASISEASQEGRRFLACWARHPSNLVASAHTALRAAS